jgi:hypothetical protein
MKKNKNKSKLILAAKIKRGGVGVLRRKNTFPL